MAELTLSIRKSVPTDLQRIKELIAENPETVLSRSDSELIELLESFLVLEEEGIVVGCCCLEVYSQKIAELRTLAVAKSCRGRGYGPKLVHAIVDEFNRKGIRQLLVVTSNPEFFANLNFGPCLNEKFALFWNGHYK